MYIMVKDITFFKWDLCILKCFVDILYNTILPLKEIYMYESTAI